LDEFSHVRAHGNISTGCFASFELVIMVGESETVSRGFTAAVNAAIWVGGFLAVFVSIFVVASMSESFLGSPDERPRAREVPRNNESQSDSDDLSLGLSPAVN